MSMTSVAEWLLLVACYSVPLAVGAHVASILRRRSVPVSRPDDADRVADRWPLGARIRSSNGASKANPPVGVIRAATAGSGGKTEVGLGLQHFSGAGRRGELWEVVGVIIAAALLAKGLSFLGGGRSAWLGAALAPLPYLPLVVLVLLLRGRDGGPVTALRVGGNGWIWWLSTGAAALAWVAGWMADYWPARIPASLGYAAIAALHLGTTTIEEYLYRGLLLPRIMAGLSESPSAGLAAATALTLMAKLIAVPAASPVALTIGTLAGAEALRHWAAWKARNYAIGIVPTALYRLLGVGV